MDESTNPFLQAFRGRLKSTLRWHEFDTTLESINQQPEDWYIYQLGTAPPEDTEEAKITQDFTQRINALIRKEHQEDYCGVIYTDSFTEPSFLKIYDPNNLGVSCGFSDNPPLPGWIMSKIKPIDIPEAMNPAKNRKRWWHKIFS